MGLAWNLENVTDQDTLCWFIAEEDHEDFFNSYKKGDEVMHPTTQTLIFLMMGIGVREITANNVANVYARIAVYEKLYGGMRRKGGESVTFTPAEVHAHIGLRTNVSDETNAAWGKRIIVRAIAEAEAAYRKEMQS